MFYFQLILSSVVSKNLEKKIIFNNKKNKRFRCKICLKKQRYNKYCSVLVDMYN